MIADTRESAARLRRLGLYGGAESVDDVYYQEGHAIGRFHTDEGRIIQAFLSENLDDDDLPIDNEFLRSLGFVHREGGHELTLTLGCLETTPQFIDSEGDRRWSVGTGHWRDVLIPGPLCPKNRGDVRRLLRQLGIEFKEGQT